MANGLGCDLAWGAECHHREFFSIVSKSFFVATDNLQLTNFHFTRLLTNEAAGFSSEKISCSHGHIIDSIHEIVAAGADAKSGHPPRNRFPLFLRRCDLFEIVGSHDHIVTGILDFIDQDVEPVGPRETGHIIVAGLFIRVT